MPDTHEAPMLIASVEIKSIAAKPYDLGPQEVR